jgi:hypothetical protein
MYVTQNAACFMFDDTILPAIPDAKVDFHCFWNKLKRCLLSNF